MTARIKFGRAYPSKDPDASRIMRKEGTAFVEIPPDEGARLMDEKPTEPQSKKRSGIRVRHPKRG